MCHGSRTFGRTPLDLWHPRPWDLLRSIKNGKRRKRRALNERLNESLKKRWMPNTIWSAASGANWRSKKNDIRWRLHYQALKTQSGWLRHVSMIKSSVYHNNDGMNVERKEWIWCLDASGWIDVTTEPSRATGKPSSCPAPCNDVCEALELLQQCHMNAPTKWVSQSYIQGAPATVALFFAKNTLNNRKNTP